MKQDDNVATNFGRLIGGLVVKWLGRWTQRLAVEGLPAGHDTAWLFIFEAGDCLWR